MPKVQFTAILKNRVGLHARPAALFVRTSKKYQCEIFVEKEGNRVDAKKILGVLGLGANKDDKITVYLDGQDALDAKEVLLEMIENKFGEE
ncbi:MAG: HPr family phosphocarrier protein [Candidatus Heimdallarchaeota archaeon]|nr:HPr family phosphocarrier protein [Candidatus Heimdallarchaeota archaeon]